MKSQSKSSRVVWFGVLLLASFILGWRPLSGTFKIAFTNDEYTQILLIIPISLAFIYMDREAVRKIARQGGAFGAVLLTAAALVAGASLLFMSRLTSDIRLALDIFALVTWWIGSFVFCFGTSVSKRLMFALGFLYWLVPLPAIILNQIIGYLQQGSAVASRVLFESAGIPLTQDGLQLTIPGLTVQIAKECSSIRSSLMLVVTTMVLAYLLLRSPWRRLLVIAISLPLSIAKNGLRIFTIAMLGTRVDPGYLNGRFHHQGGIVFFAISLLIIFLILWVLQRGEKPTIESRSLKAALPC
jgi:exosortase